MDAAKVQAKADAKAQVSHWSTNNLILKDPLLRKKAGVSVLDKQVEAMGVSVQSGGAMRPYHYFNDNRRW